LGAISTTSTDVKWLVSWIAVIGTILGSLAAFTFAGRYKYLATSYNYPARGLKWLRNAYYRLPDSEKPERVNDFHTGFRVRHFYRK
jgi:hypothetical protein